MAEPFADGLATEDDLRRASLCSDGPMWTVADPDAVNAARLCAQATELTARSRVGLLRDLFGNPFQPVKRDPAWPSAAVVALARAASEERRIP